MLVLLFCLSHALKRGEVDVKLQADLVLLQDIPVSFRLGLDVVLGLLQIRLDPLFLHPVLS